MKRTTLSVIALFATLAMATVLGGCAQDMGTIDRTQHNITKKSDILGKEFYFRMTVLKTPFTSAYSTPGDQGRLERGIFDIREDNLYFYRTYEWIEGAEYFGAKSDTDTPLLDEDGNPVTYTACVDGAGRILEDDIDCASVDGGEMKEIQVYVYRGAPLATFPIESHFDVIYTYNPATGEKTNVKVENSSERMWYERDYMRVSWGNGDIKNFSRLMLLELRALYPELMNDVADDDDDLFDYEDNPNLVPSFTMYKGDADEPRYQNRMLFREDENGEETVHYMDFVFHWVLQAPTIYYEYWDENVPLCWFYPWAAGGVFECASEELTVRTAFLEVPDDDRYASTDYDDNRLEKFGFFRAERQFYDREQGSRYDTQIQKAFLHPIWEAGRDENGDRLAVAARTPQPIVYYLSEAFPRELVDEAVEMGNQWSQPFEDVVSHYKGDSPEMFVICENNNLEAEAAMAAGATWFAPGNAPGTTLNAVAYHGVEGEAGYNELCADMDLGTKYNGDLRYNFLHAVTDPHMNGLLGFGPPSADPLTGRIINSNAYIYTPQIKLYAARVMDVIETMAGIRNLSEYMSALYVDMDQKSNAIVVAENTTGLVNRESALDIASTLVKPEVLEHIQREGFERTDTDWAQARADIIKADPTMERAMIDSSVRMLFRDPTANLTSQLSDDLVEKATLPNWANHNGFQRKLSIQLEAANRALDLVGFADPAISGYVYEYGRRFDDAVCTAFADREDLIFDYSAFNDVKADADTADGDCASLGATDDNGYVCQTVGDRQLWVNVCTTAKLLGQIRAQLRAEEGIDPYAYWPPDALWTNSHVPAVAQSQIEIKALLDSLREEFMAELYQQLFLAIATHEVGHTLGLRHNFAASTDAINYPEEYWYLKAGVVDPTRQSAFADGVYKPSADGPGYTWVRETQTQQQRHLRRLQSASVMDYGGKFDSEFTGVGHYDTAAIKYGYGNLVEVFSQAPDLDDYRPFLASPTGDQPSNWGVSYTKHDEMEEIFRRVHYTNIPNAFGTDDSAISAMYDRVDVELGAVTDAQVEVPYRYCEGDRIGSDPWCWTRDSGADPFEIVVNAMDDYENYDWFFYGYSHGSAMFWPEDYSDRIRYKFYLGKLQYQWWALNMAHFNANDWWATEGPGAGAGENGEDLAWHEDPNGGLSGTLAAYEAYSTMAGAFGRPVPGYYGRDPHTNRYIYLAENVRITTEDNFRIFEDQGARPMYAGWANEGYDIYPIHAGAIYERMAAFEVMTDPTCNFLGVDETADARKYKLSFFHLFPAQTLNLLGGVLTGQVEGFGWCVDYDDEARTATVFKRDYLEGLTCSAGQTPMDPEETDYTFSTTKYRIPMLAAYYGMSFMISDYDRSFMDVTRVFLKGHGTAVTLPEDVDVVEFEHPFSGKIYVAYKSGLDDEYSPAYYIVEAANAALDTYRDNEGVLDMDLLRRDYDDSALSFLVGKLELIRSMHELFDYTSLDGAGL